MGFSSVIKTVVALIGLAICSGSFAGEGEPQVTDVKDWNKEGGEKSEAMLLVPDRERGIAVYEVCSACHLLEGWGLEDGTFPQLAGQHRNVLIKQLTDIRAKNRDNPTMYPFALDEQIMAVAGYHEGEINPAQLVADVTDYISKLPMNPQPGVGPWEKNTPEFEQGKKLYMDNCTQCHGDDGEGSNEKFYPRIQGQHYNYMLRQFEWIRDGKRRNANPDMVSQIKGFTDKDMQMVINYTSRHMPPAKDLAPSVDYQNPDYD
ncbi:MAG: c-type cytochrome [Gammaproteobacteria bacterium]|nr:c-type cytochrome [Gammaproteobacteria bacterium]MCP5416080.1 c-type cytochrome [Chromatiaceae bacterium]